MEDSASIAVGLIEDNQLRTLPSPKLAARLNTIHTQLGGCVTIAVSAAAHAVHHAIALGQVLAEGMRRYEGDFAEWLASAGPSGEDGKPAISESTALRYRTLWAKREKIFPPDGSAPPPRNLYEAYVKVGLLPEPEAGGGDADVVKALFRVTYSLPTTPPETWPPAERRAFLTKVEPLAKLYLQALELTSAAA